MKNANEDLLCVSPVKNYEPPRLPTLKDTRSNPELLFVGIPIARSF